MRTFDEMGYFDPDYQWRKLDEAKHEGRPWGQPTDYEPWILAYGQVVLLGILLALLLWMTVDAIL